ncbi:MAG: hypothetical protein ACRDSR_20400 [Pseudonocardiaceae bacterium]
MTDFPIIQPTGGDNRRVLHASCSCPGVANGFANLVVSRRNGCIELDPHATGSCTLTLADDDACELRDALTGWLG